MKFAGTILQDTVGYDIYKTFEDLFLLQENKDGMILEGIQSKVYARSAQARETRKPWASMLKTS